MNLAPFIGGAATGVAVAVSSGSRHSQPQAVTEHYLHARCQLLGADTLSYVALNASGASAPAVVTIDGRRYVVPIHLKMPW
jgi:hypothetical protein